MSNQRTAKAVDLNIGKRVRERRLEIAMSQERLAELVGVTFQQIQKYEKGVNRVAASRLFDIARALDVEIAYFFTDIGRGGQTSQARGKRPPTRRPAGG